MYWMMENIYENLIDAFRKIWGRIPEPDEELSGIEMDVQTKIRNTEISI